MNLGLQIRCTVEGQLQNLIISLLPELKAGTFAMMKPAQHGRLARNGFIVIFHKRLSLISPVIPTSYLNPPTSYLNPPTSYLKPTTSYLLPPTLKHSIPSIIPVFPSSLRLNSSTFIGWVNTLVPVDNLSV